MSDKRCWRSLLGLLFLSTFVVTTMNAHAGTTQMTMYDASVTQISHIPTNAQMIGYGPAWRNANIDAFPNAVHVGIADSSTDYSRPVIDFEWKYTFTCAGLQQWIVGHQALHQGYGTVYTWRGNIAVVQICLAGYTYYLWVADQTGVQHSYPGPPNEVATQWCGNGNCPGNPYVDESLVTSPVLAG
jgi:hypothetical protein